MRILAIDDDPGILNALVHMLHCRHEIDVTTDPAMGAEMIKQKQYDFIVLDYQMPGRNGAWFMRNAAVPRSVKVLLLTGSLNKTMLKEMFALGIAGYLVKPVAADEIVEHLEFHCRAPALSEPGLVEA